MQESRAQAATVDSGDRQSADGSDCVGPSHSSDLLSWEHCRRTTHR